MITRRGIDLAYDEFLERKRAKALEHLLSLEGDDLPDPRELKRQILTKYDPLP